MALSTKMKGIARVHPVQLMNVEQRQNSHCSEPSQPTSQTDVTRSVLSRNFIARQNRKCDI